MGLAGFNVSNTELVQVITDRLYRPDGTKRAVVWLHGSGDDQLECWTGQSGAYWPTLRAVACAGLPIVVPLCGGTKNWGNDAAQTRVTDAITYARASFGASSAAVILVGLSMGGLLALNYLRNNPTSAAATLLLYPAVNLVAHHDATGGSSDFSTDINTAYTDLAGYNAAKATHDPAQNAASYTGKRIKMWRSTADAAVGTANQDNFATAVGGSTFETQSLGAAAHPDMTAVDPIQVVSYINTYA